MGGTGAAGLDSMSTWKAVFWSGGGWGFAGGWTFGQG